jgi:hypothetical protein
MKLVLMREGEFNPLNMVENNNRCGQLGLMHYKYVVQVENSRIHNYFLTRYCNPRKSFDAMSCENMATKAAMDIGRTLVKEHISVTGVTVTIVGSNAARIQATWQREGDKNWETNYWMRENARPKTNPRTKRSR